MTNKSLFITVLLLIFLSQSITASAIPCQMDMTTTIEQTIDHSAHNMDSDTTNCELDCQCPMATCVSVVITSINRFSSTQKPSVKFLLLASQQTTQSLTSLYRPPITH